MSDSDDENVTAMAVDVEGSDTSVAGQAYEHDIEEDDEDEDVEVAAAAVEEDRDDGDAADVEAEVEAEVVAVPVEESIAKAMDAGEEDEDLPTVATATPKPPAKKSPRKQQSSSKKANTAPKKKSRPERSNGISGARLMAAEAARDILNAAVPKLPVAMNENYVVRNFGQLVINQKGSNAFATPTSLYPVGFSCDRFEFSPVHGRLLKLRCTIIDGRRTNLNYAGPIFRVMWGPGVDEAVDKVEYPYDPYVNSAPISSSENDVVAIPTTSGKSQRPCMPSRGMRVKVRFDDNKYYFGTIDKVEAPKEDGKKKRKRNHDIRIRYDDGSTEKLEFPDPDVSLVMPGKCCQRHQNLKSNGNFSDSPFYLSSTIKVSGMKLTLMGALNFPF